MSGNFPTYLFAAVEDAGRDFVSVNNQSSTPMKMRLDNFVFVLHDNRIYVFDYPLDLEANAPEEDPSASRTSSAEQNLILNILTTPYFRALNCIYFTFRLLDNTALVIIFVLSVINHAFTTPDATDLSLYGVIGLELFYDVMLTVNKYWSLQRLSFNIGLLLYAMYFSVVLWKYSVVQQFTAFDATVVASVLGFRFVSFLLEEATDVAIDCCLHNAIVDLSSLAITANGDMTRRASISLYEQLVTFMRRSDASDRAESTATDLTDDPLTLHEQWLLSTTAKLRGLLRAHDCTIPRGIVYIGSFFAWSTVSVYDIREELTASRSSNSLLQTGHIPWFLIKTLLALPILLTTPFAFALCVMIVLAVVLALVAAFIVGGAMVGLMWLSGALMNPKQRSLSVNYLKELCRF